ncbi:SGNH/GDSL hydrolase family protein [Micromonospora zamorensis]|uniref:SGNH/GDSL hydrolase family protein n=1 Tax=Micromonospora zamorensis TaxID=709883 RepID=UPI003D9033DB
MLVVAGSTNVGVTKAAAAPASAQAADGGDFALTTSAAQLGIDPAAAALTPGALPSACLDSDPVAKAPAIAWAEPKLVMANMFLGLASVISYIITSENEKADKVKEAVRRVAYCFPGYNVVIAQPHNGSTQHMTEAYFVTTIELSDTKYRVYVFKSGTFYQAGDLGYKNWGYNGYFTKSDDGRTVTFTTPPLPERRSGWSSGPQCEVTTRDRVDRNMYYSLYNGLSNDAQVRHVRALLNDVRTCFPDYNVMVMHDEQSHEWLSPPTSQVFASAFSMQDYDAKDSTEVGRPSGVASRGRYDVHVFKTGTFHNMGDGGWNNWAFYGNFTRSSDGMTVAFTDPATTDLTFDPMAGFLDSNFDSDTPQHTSTANGPYPGCGYTGSVPGDREELVRSLTTEYQKCFPDTNILVVKSVDQFSFGYLSNLKHLANVNGMTVFALDVGVVKNNGDGGWINWGFNGNYERDGDSTVYFTHLDGPDPTGSVRVMVVGDSMSQGDEGDWTWRYRLSEWFREQGVDAEFVGPYKGTVPARAPGRKPPTLQGQLPEPETESTRFGGEYDKRAETFDDDEHFAMWGQQAAVAKSLIQYQVQQQKPDLILLGLGFNDLGWSVTNPKDTVDSMKMLVDRARDANPNIKLAIANVPQRTLLSVNRELPDKTNDYNSRLAQEIPTWNTAQSPVKLVKWRENYDCEPTSCPAGYDGLHPNATGEYQIARAFTETLHNDFGYGAKPLDIPTTIPDRPKPIPDGITAGAGPQGVTVNWPKVFGAHGYTVRSRLVGTTTWNESRVQANRHETLSPKDLTWEYQVRTDNGDTDDQKSDWSLPPTRATANPTAPPGPTGIITQPTATGFTITWGVPTNPDAIERYEVLYWDQDTPNAILSSTGIKGFSARIDGLNPNHRYIIAVASWNTAGSGLPNNARPIRVGTTTPTAPTGLQINPLDANTVQLTWTKNDTAAGYRVWTRDLTNGSPLTPSDQTFTEPTHGIAYLTSGFWNYEYCVTSINGTLESARTTCVTPTRPAGS